jgi:excisionase family DNA binding protein
MRAAIKKSSAKHEAAPHSGEVAPKKERPRKSVALARVQHAEPATVLTRITPGPAALEAAFLALLQSKTALSAVPAALPIDRRIFLTMAESADLTGLPAAFLRRLMATGKLRALKTGAGWRIARVELEKLSGALTETPTDLTEHELRDLEVNRRRRQGTAPPSDTPFE